MGKLRRRNARRRKAGGLKLDMEFGSPIQSERAKQHWHRDGIRLGNADMSGRQRTLPIRRFVVVRVVLVRAIGIPVVVCVNLMNQLEVLQQRVR